MALTGPAHRTPAHSRPHVAARKFGYLIAITLNTVFFYLINFQPGWQVLPFLTPETAQVLDLLNFSAIAAIVINTVYLVYDARRCKALGDFLLAIISLAVLHRTEQGKELVQLDLGDTHVVQEVAREGCGVIRHLNQPGEHRVGVHLKDPGDCANAKSFSQRPDGPHQLVR